MERTSYKPGSERKGKVPEIRADDSFRGFSLFEMLIVLIMLSIITGVSAPAIGKFLDNLSFRKEVDKVASHLRKYRLQAVTEGKKVAVWQEGQQFFSSGLGKETGQLWYEGSAGKSLTMEPALLVFTPYSTATPARLSLIYDGRTATIKMDPLSGLPVVQ